MWHRVAHTLKVVLVCFEKNVEDCVALSVHRYKLESATGLWG